MKIINNLLLICNKLIFIFYKFFIFIKECLHTKPVYLIDLTAHAPLWITFDHNQIPFFQYLMMDQLNSQSINYYEINQSDLLPTCYKTTLLKNPIYDLIKEKRYPIIKNIDKNLYSGHLLSHINSYIDKLTDQSFHRDPHLLISNKYQLGSLHQLHQKVGICMLVSGQLDIYLYPPKYEKYFLGNQLNLNVLKEHSSHKIPLLEEKIKLNSGQLVIIPNNWWFAYESQSPVIFVLIYINLDSHLSTYLRSFKKKVKME